MTSIAIDTAGLHPTTASCLEALQWLHSRQKMHNMLDIGCGNGILSLTAASLWKAPVLAADIAQQAVTDTQNNIANHGMERYVTAVRSEGFHHELIKTRAPFDLVITNLLAEPIARMAPEVRAHITDGGYCILSGILSWMAAEVESVYGKYGFAPVTSLVQTPWHTLVLRYKDEISH